jgi:transcriptional regulator NrdR family protein
VSALPCPTCGAAETTTIDARWRPGIGARLRRRRCLGCGGSFVTYEFIIASSGAAAIVAEIDRARRMKKMSYAKLARRAGVGRSTITSWLIGRRRAMPDLGTADAVLAALGLRLTIVGRRS